MERDTRQRKAIRQSIEDAARPLSPQEILEFAQAAVPGLGMATVYRSIKGLVEEGWLRAVELPGRPPAYEVAGKEHHHHFHCRKCGRVFEVEGCPGNLKKLAPPGFVVEEHEVVLYGLCDRCKAA